MMIPLLRVVTRPLNLARRLALGVLPNAEVAMSRAELDRLTG